MAGELELYLYFISVSRAADRAEAGAAEEGVAELLAGLELVRQLLTGGLPDSERVVRRWLRAVQELRNEYRMTLH